MGGKLEEIDSETTLEAEDFSWVSERFGLIFPEWPLLLDLRLALLHALGFLLDLVRVELLVRYLIHE